MNKGVTATRGGGEPRPVEGGATLEVGALPQSVVTARILRHLGLPSEVPPARLATALAG